MLDNDYTPQPNPRSPAILLSFPPELLHLIFHQILLEGLYTTNGVSTRLSCRTLHLRTFIRSTKPIRAVCPPWARAMHSLIFHGKETRDNILIRLPRLLDPPDLHTFPALRDCFIKFGWPYFLRDLSALNERLSTSTIPLTYITAVAWREDEPMDIMRNKTSHLGYGRLETELITAFTDECHALGLGVIDERARAPSGYKYGHHSEPGYNSKGRDEAWTRSARAALSDFMFKELLALWYYNAQIARQILGMFPALQYVSLPRFLHVPLLAKMKWFFPQCGDRNNDPAGEEGGGEFGAISGYPPQMLGYLGIVYREGGRPYKDIMAQVKVVEVGALCYNPILALFSWCGYNGWRVNWATYSVLRMNRWQWEGDDDLGRVVPERIRYQIRKAVGDIPARTRERVKLFEVERLMDVMRDYRDEDSD